jgi:hypothetical protein
MWAAQRCRQLRQVFSLATKHHDKPILASNRARANVAFENVEKTAHKIGKNKTNDSTLADERTPSYLIENKRNRTCPLDTLIGTCVPQFFVFLRRC